MDNETNPIRINFGSALEDIQVYEDVVKQFRQECLSLHESRCQFPIGISYWIFFIFSFAKGKCIWGEGNIAPLGKLSCIGEIGGAL